PGVAPEPELRGRFVSRWQRRAGCALTMSAVAVCAWPSCVPLNTTRTAAWPRHVVGSTLTMLTLLPWNAPTTFCGSRKAPAGLDVGLGTMLPPLADSLAGGKT